MKKNLIICFLLLLIALPANALQQLKFKGFIADEANLISDSVENDLNMTLWDLQKKSGADIAVVTLRSLNGKTVEETALEIGRTYKIGSKEKNNGVVFLTALKERKLRIELGTGLENKITINQLENIRDNDILPYYKTSDYQNGIARGTYQLAALVAKAEGVTINSQGTCPSKPSRPHKNRYPSWIYIFILIMGIFGPRNEIYGNRYYRGFGGFGGGGGFGGCGCSGSW